MIQKYNAPKSIISQWQKKHEKKINNNESNSTLKILLKHFLSDWKTIKELLSSPKILIAPVALNYVSVMFPGIVFYTLAF